MKNIKTFESYGYEVKDISSQFPIKKYGDEFPLSNLSPGDSVVYLGAKFTVESVDDYVMVLRSNDGSTIKVNQNMFNTRGFIGKDYVPSKMM